MSFTKILSQNSRIDPALTFHKFMDKVIHSMHLNALRLLQYSLAIVFFWFGILKPLGMSPAADLVKRTVFWFSADWFVPFLGFWEVTIGLLMLSQKTMRYALVLLFLQIPGTFLPLIICPDVTFQSLPFELTLEGQYIIKNLILIAAAITVAGSFDRSVQKENLLR